MIGQVNSRRAIIEPKPVPQEEEAEEGEEKEEEIENQPEIKAETPAVIEDTLDI